MTTGATLPLQPQMVTVVGSDSPITYLALNGKEGRLKAKVRRIRVITG